MIVTPATDPNRRSSNLASRLKAGCSAGADRLSAAARRARSARAARPADGPGGSRFRVHPVIAIAAGAVLVIAVIALSRYYFLAELHDDVLKTAQANLAHQSIALAEQADGSLKALDLVLSSVGDYIGRSGVTDGESYRRVMGNRETHRLLQEKITGLPFVDAIELIDPSGRLVNFSRGWPIPAVSHADRDYFQALKNDSTLESYISKPVHDPVNGAWDIFLARRLSDPNGEFMGLLLGALRVQSFENFFRSTVPADGTAVSLLRADGMLLAGAPRVQELGTYAQPDQGGGGEAATLSSAHLLPNYPLLVLLSRRPQDALRGWRRMAEQMALMTALSAVMVLIAAVVIARWRSQQAALARAGIEKVEMEAERAEARREIEMRTAHEASLAAERTKLRAANAELRVSKHRAEAANAKLQEVEEALRRKAVDLEAYSGELQRSNAELEQFAYIASHDLQEPLRMVTSYCQLLQRRYAAKLGEDAAEFIAFAVDGAARMRQLIQDLLAYSRVGRIGGSLEPLDMNAIVDAALGNLAGAIAESEAHIERDPLPAVTGERVQLVQIFQNLIGNAIKFRRDEPPCVRIAATDGGDGFAHFTIEDNGIGIEADQLDRVFVIFQRLHEREKYAGTGIGLAIVKKVIEHHHGRIWIESTLGRGSRFHFTLPTSQELL